MKKLSSKERRQMVGDLTGTVVGGATGCIVGKFAAEKLVGGNKTAKSIALIGLLSCGIGTAVQRIVSREVSDDVVESLDCVHGIIKLFKKDKKQEVEAE